MNASRFRVAVAGLATLGIAAVTVITVPSAVATFEPPVARITPLPPRTGSYAAQAIDEPLFPLADTFKLHSSPGANRVIYLDFNGETLTNTAWNNSYSQPTINADPYDTDGSPSTFSDSERASIQSAWQRVAEDYAPFAVDVTTEDPGYDAINRSGSTDQNFGTRALITNMTTGASTCGCAGVGYIGTYDITSSHAYYQPALIFQRGSGPSGKNVGEVVSHEVGHNLGLDHDGTASASYYTGQGAWAPIMGSGYSRPVTQFDKGEYTGASSTQDDFSVMAANGATPVSDDYGNTTATAATLGTGRKGIIGSASDVDVFSFGATGGSVTLSATPEVVGPNLDIKLEVLNAAGSVVTTVDPPAARVSADMATGLNASTTLSLTAGTYYARIQGTGYGSPTADGYSKYGSVGRYSIAATGAVGGTPTTTTTTTVPTTSTTSTTVPPSTTTTVPPSTTTTTIRTTTTTTAPSLGVSINDVTKYEGAYGYTYFTFTISLSAPAPRTTSVRVAMGNGSATSGVDYLSFSARTVSFSTGQRTKTVQVTVRGDRTRELDEQFTLWLSTPSTGLTITDSMGVGTIRNDD